MFAKFMWRRLALAILVCTGFTVISSWCFYTCALPSKRDLPSVVLVTLFYGLLYFFLVPIFCVISIAIGRLGAPRAIVFAICFVTLTAGWSYTALSGYDFYQQGIRVLVVNNTITAAGWHDFLLGTAEDFAIAVTTAAILFWQPQRTSI